jgi:hypothetical protein
MSSPIVYDKAKYHHETVTEWGLDCVQTEVHTALFLGWLLDNDLMSDFFNEEFPDLAGRYKSREIDALKVYEWWDCALVDDMLSDAGNAFAQAYFDFSRGQYLADYAELLVRDLPSEYHVHYSCENYEVLRKRIDQRYREWQGQPWER